MKNMKTKEPDWQTVYKNIVEWSASNIFLSHISGFTDRFGRLLSKYLEETIYSQIRTTSSKITSDWLKSANTVYMWKVYIGKVNVQSMSQLKNTNLALRNNYIHLIEKSYFKTHNLHPSRITIMLVSISRLLKFTNIKVI